LEEKDVKAREKWNKEISPSLLSLKYNKEDLKNFVSTSTNEIKSLNDAINELKVKKTKSEEIIANYRDYDEYIYDVQKYIDEHLICEAALGFENSVEEFKREIERMEEETLDDFISDYVDIYEKEI
jgi:hypothetical protein